MKKKLLVILLMFISLNSFYLASQDMFNYRGQDILGGGLSLGYYSYGFTGSRSIGIPPLSAYYELGLHDHITAGPFLGYARWSYKYAVQDYRYSWSFINAGARGSFHITGFMNEILGTEIDEEKIDWYLTLLAGMEFRQYSDTGNNTLGYANQSNFFIGPSAGVRYYFSENLAVYLEGGRGAFGAVSFGVSLRR